MRFSPKIYIKMFYLGPFAAATLFRSMRCPYVGAWLGVCFGVRGVSADIEGGVVKFKCED